MPFHTRLIDNLILSAAQVRAGDGLSTVSDVVSDYEKLVDEFLGEGTMRMAEVATGLYPADESDIAVDCRSTILVGQSVSSHPSGLIDQVLLMAKLGLRSSRSAHV